jgi:hypothetical protein
MQKEGSYCVRAEQRPDKFLSQSRAESCFGGNGAPSASFPLFIFFALLFSLFTNDASLIIFFSHVKA